MIRTEYCYILPTFLNLFCETTYLNQMLTFDHYFLDNLLKGKGYSMLPKGRHALPPDWTLMSPIFQFK